MKLDVVVQELSPGGDGVAIAEIDGERRAIFVPRVALGEKVRVEFDAKKRPARGQLLEIIEPSKQRVTPACAYFEPCGGCDYMHLDANAQADAHAAIVKSILPEPREVTVHRAPKALAYRLRARVHVSSEKQGGLKVGMFAPKSTEPVPVDTCMVLEPALDRFRGQLAELLAGAKGRGEASMAMGEQLPVLDLKWAGEIPAEVFARIEKAVGKTLAGVRIWNGEVRIPATIGDPTPWMTGPDGRPLVLAPGGFSQASSEGNAVLAARVFALASELATEGAPITELYAGAGNLTVLLAKRFVVTAVESERAACNAAKKNLGARSLEAKVLEADASTFAIPNNAKLVVLDPPRTGALAASKLLAASRAAAVLYVSCDPATLGRDLKVLAERFVVKKVETFELFPQTSHVETVVALERRR